MEISTEKFGYKIPKENRSDKNEHNEKYTNRSSRGEMNTSLRLMIYRREKKTGE
jgi:hypothetical protein